MKIFVICNCYHDETFPKPIQPPEMYVKLEVSTYPIQPQMHWLWQVIVYFHNNNKMWHDLVCCCLHARSEYLLCTAS